MIKPRKLARENKIVQSQITETYDVVPFKNGYVKSANISLRAAVSGYYQLPPKEKIAHILRRKNEIIQTRR